MTKNADIWTAVETAEAAAPFAFRIHKDGKVLKTVRLELGTTYIGRMPENHVTLDDARVSRSHACVTKMENGYVICDQESENGLYVKGKRVKEHPLQLGEKITVGDHILEVVAAEEKDRTEKREHLLEQSEEEEWRMEQTMSVSPKEMAKIVARLKEKKAEARTDARPKNQPKVQTEKESPAAAPPKLIMNLQIGKEEFKKEVAITQGRARKDTDPDGNFIEFRIGYGKWILYKKEPL